MRHRDLGDRHGDGEMAARRMEHDPDERAAAGSVPSGHALPGPITI
jgi:hypothetical protein